MQLMQLPDVVLDEIFSYLTYDEVAKCRVLSRNWNAKCKDTLNRGFFAVEKYHAQCFKKYKALLPRRESERRNHIMARHCDILTAIETRLSMLSMTYSKFIDARLCCFIPGKVTDEIFRVLYSIRNMKHPPRPHEVLQELRDISSMAMEHFDEHIVPRLRSGISISSLHTCGRHLDLVTGNNSSTPSSSTVPITMGVRPNVNYTLYKFRSELLKRARSAGKTKKSMTGLRTLLNTFIQKVNSEHKQLNHKISAQDEKLKAQEGQLTEMKRQLDEWDHKFTDLAAKLSRVPDMADISPSRAEAAKHGTKRPVKAGKSSVAGKPSAAGKSNAAEACSASTSNEAGGSAAGAAKLGTKRTRGPTKVTELASISKKTRTK